MLKIRKGNVLVFAIDDGNITRLKDGKPIKFNLKELGMDDTTVYICWGKDENELRAMFKDQIDPLKTIIKDYKSPNN